MLDDMINYGDSIVVDTVEKTNRYGLPVTFFSVLKNTGRIKPVFTSINPDETLNNIEWTITNLIEILEEEGIEILDSIIHLDGDKN